MLSQYHIGLKYYNLMIKNNFIVMFTFSFTCYLLNLPYGIYILYMYRMVIFYIYISVKMVI